MAGETDITMGSRLGAEFIGTFVLVFGGTGAAVLAAQYVDPTTSEATGQGIGFLGVSLAFGLTVVVGAYALGHISGGHFNPAITIALAVARKFPTADVLAYVVTQVVAAVLASGTLWLIAINRDGATKELLASGGFAANGYGDHSPGRFSLFACLLIEVLLTAVFLIVISGVTDGRAPAALAPLAIGLSLTLVHLVSIPVTNTSVNPARSTGPALMLAFAGDGWAIGQLWLFWFAPILGGILGAVAYSAVAAGATSRAATEAR
jgi:aquaporin Z